MMLMHLLTDRKYPFRADLFCLFIVSLIVALYLPFSLLFEEFGLAYVFFMYFLNIGCQQTS